MPDVSIAISAKDNYSGVLLKIRNSQTAFRKDTESLNRELERFNRTKVDLKVDLTKAKKELQDAQKEFKKTGDAAKLDGVREAQENYDRIKDNLDAVSKQARQTQKDLNDLIKTDERKGNRAGSSGAGSSIISRIGQSGLIGMVGNVASDAANTFVSSAFGSRTGEMFGSVLSGITSGAAMGTMLGGPVGTAVGAAVGAATGAVQGAVNNFKSEDDAFKSIVQSQYDTVTEKEKSMLENGTNVYAAREMTGVSFETLIGKEATDKLMPQLKTYADITPFAYDTIMNAGNLLLGFSVPQDKLMERIGQLGDLSGGNADKFASVVRAYGKSSSKGKVQLEDLNIMTEAGVPILNALAEKYGGSVSKVYDAISKGKVTLGDLDNAIAGLTSDGGQFHGMLDKMSTTYSGLLSTKEGVDDDRDAAMGKGYAEERKKGLADEIAFAETEANDKLKAAYEKIGTFKASLENTYEQSVRDSIFRAMNTEQYLTAEREGNAAEMGRILKKAEVDAQIAYHNSEGYQMFQSSEMALVNNLQNSLAPSWQNFGYQMGLEFNKGLASTEHMQKQTAERWASFFNSKKTPQQYVEQNLGWKPNAWGLSFVPYDGYPAILHEGERVMTASENRRYSSGSSKSSVITITGNNFTISNANDIDALASALADKIEEAREGYTNA